MDRISKALELARQGGQLRTPNGAGAAGAADHKTDIVYTHTKSVSLSPAFLQEQRVISGSGMEPIADAYRVLRTRVMQRMEQNRWKTLGITSPGPQEGKTLTAINLSISIARELSRSVLLVDADLRRPSVHKRMGFKVDQGLSDCLVSDVPIEDVLVHPGIERLTVLPGREGLRDSSERIASAAMIRLVQETRSRYPSRMVIFDLPPTLVGDDVVAFAPHLDAVLIVVEEGKTDSDGLARTGELLAGVEVVGSVLNKSVDKTSGYEYYYGATA